MAKQAGAGAGPVRHVPTPLVRLIHALTLLWLLAQSDENTVTEPDDVSDVELKSLVYPNDIGEPPAVHADGGSPQLRVELKFCIDEISSVNTLNGTAMAKVWIGLAWKDPRLRNKTDFPKGYWEPSVVLTNRVGTDVISTHPEAITEITDSKSGQCYRLIYGEGNFRCETDLHEYTLSTPRRSALWSES